MDKSVKVEFLSNNAEFGLQKHFFIGNQIANVHARSKVPGNQNNLTGWSLQSELLMRNPPVIGYRDKNILWRFGFIQAIF